MQKLAAVILGLLALSGTAGATTIADLGFDFSNVSNPNNTNPNGTWEYRQGTSDIANAIPDWQSECSGSPAQPAWAPSNNPGDFIPAFFKSACNQTTNFATGDMIVHTYDGTNGSPSNGIPQIANWFFTSKVSGTFEISGTVWDAGQNSSRPQNWTVEVNGVQKASGNMNGLVTKASPNPFDLTNVFFTPGTTVELDEFAVTDGPGNFVGSTLTISGTITAVPEPGTLALFGLSLGAAALRLWRRRRA